MVAPSNGKRLASSRYSPPARRGSACPSRIGSASGRGLTKRGEGRGECHREDSCQDELAISSRAFLRKSRRSSGSGVLPGAGASLLTRGRWFHQFPNVRLHVAAGDQSTSALSRTTTPGGVADGPGRVGQPPIDAGSAEYHTSLAFTGWMPPSTSHTIVKHRDTVVLPRLPGGRAGAQSTPSAGLHTSLKYFASASRGVGRPPAEHPHAVLWAPSLARGVRVRIHIGVGCWLGSARSGNQ